MKHRIAFRKLSRDQDHKRALFKNQVTQLIQYESIETTVAKAKELRRIADKIITLGKKQTLTSARKVHDFVQTTQAGNKVCNELAPRFMNRNGGYTRVLKTRFRRGDCAPMAVIEWSDTDKSILTKEQLERKDERKTKHRRHQPPVGLAVALE